MIEFKYHVKIDTLEGEQLFHQNSDEISHFLKNEYGINIIGRLPEVIVQSTLSEEMTKKFLEELFICINTTSELTVSTIVKIYEQVAASSEYEPIEIISDTRGRVISAKSSNQAKYIKDIQNSDLVFGVGPAGTGKTFLAVCLAVKQLRNKDVEKIIITRPAVEAGESLGFLPGDMKEKVDPYLQPIYDSLNILLGGETVDKLIERKIIEIAPIAYMRGRTLNDAFVILDEAQNVTREQMKMFLTRLGVNSKMVVTGDDSQIDLRNKNESGLKHALTILNNIKGIKIVRLTAVDVMRHYLVRRIINAYEGK